jgi:hypothetical protein
MRWSTCTKGDHVPLCASFKPGVMVPFPYEAGKSVELEGENPWGVCAATWAASRPIVEARKVEACIFKVTVAL